MLATVKGQHLGNKETTLNSAVKGVSLIKEFSPAAQMLPLENNHNDQTLTQLDVCGLY